MIYTERQPGPTLKGCIRLLWYCKAPHLPHARERILPRGEIQIILNLAGETLTEHPSRQSEQVLPLPPSIIVGPRGRYDLVDTRDLAELVGIVFRPGGASPFLHEDAGAFFEKFIALEEVASARNLRAQLQEQGSPAQKLQTIESWLTTKSKAQPLRRKPAAIHALNLLRSLSVRETARSLSISERRLHQIMTTEVGLSPKVWSRIQRFQHAVNLLHSGAEPRWEQLALACGFYDQSHFCNEFRAFSGIDPSTYATSPRLWANHVPE
jgi:AraC-like DNA-binding protein